MLRRDYAFWRTSVLLEASFAALLLTALGLLVVGLTGRGWSPDPLELAAVATSFACTYLCVVQSRLNYPIGVLTTALYVALFVRAGLPGSAAANAYLVVALIYGWFRWGPDDDTRHPTWLLMDGPVWIVMHVAVSVALFAGATVIYLALGEKPNDADLAIMALTILAQLLLDNKRTETWFVWMAVNVLAIVVYSSANLPLVAFQYVVFLVNAFFGLYAWTRGVRSLGGTRP